MTPEQKARTIVRSDSGFGSDPNIDFALDEGWQVLTKGSGGKRPTSFARKIADESWQAMGDKRWVAPTPKPPLYTQPVQHWIIRWQTQHNQLKYATLLCSVPSWSIHQVLDSYDDRATCEIEIRSDKSGLRLEQRRKHSLAAQEVLILLTDLAHNTLAWLTPILFPEGALALFGTTRMTQDILTIPGRLLFHNHHLREVHLNKLHPYAHQTADGLLRLLDYFGHP